MAMVDGTAGTEKALSKTLRPSARSGGPAGTATGQQVGKALFNLSGPLLAPASWLKGSEHRRGKALSTTDPERCRHEF
ncbi:MAG TPA: hypothetical protein PLY75_17570, partial [Gammaproteobacteria bacterium]|nr:hypothetical protein [Gammaproteobacteria bacterium]